MMRHAKILSSGVVCRDVFMYSSHPHAVLTAEGAILVVFNQTRRRPFILHPPHDPGYRNLISRSSDGGESWNAARVMHSCRSSDGGRTWSAPIPTGIDGYPPHLLVLSDHRIYAPMAVAKPISAYAPCCQRTAA